MNRIVSLLLTLVLLAAALVALWIYVGGLEPSRRALVLDEVAGEVVRTRDGVPEPGRVGMVLAPGDRIRTGEDGEAVASRGGEAPVRLLPRTEVTLLGVDDQLVELELLSGEVRFRVRPDAGAVRLVSRGQDGHERNLLATDAEGRARVAPDGTLLVEAERGTASTSGLNGITQVPEGGRLAVLPDGSASVTTGLDALLLDVAWPERTQETTVVLEGTSWPGARVLVRAEQLEVETRADAEGRFEATLALTTGDETEVSVLAEDGFGRTAEAREVLGSVEEPEVFLRFDLGRRDRGPRSERR